MPADWSLEMPSNRVPDGPDGWFIDYRFFPMDNRPRLIRLLLPKQRDTAGLLIRFAYSGSRPSKYESNTQAPNVTITHSYQYAFLVINSKDRKVAAALGYTRSNATSFKATYERICDSLRIE
jgi:hypothetical protein